MVQDSESDEDWWDCEYCDAQFETKLLAEKHEIACSSEIPTILLYIVSCCIPILGILIGVIFLQNTGEEGKHHRTVGKNCIKCAFVIPLLVLTLIGIFAVLAFISWLLSA